MSPPLRTGLIVALIHVALVSTLGAKLLVDRAIRPRVWVRTAPVDPSLPIRGRYVRLQIELETDGALLASPPNTWNPVELTVGGDRLAAVPSARSGLYASVMPRDGRNVLVLTQPLAYFIPEHVTDPSTRPGGEELWVEVTVPRRGAPRPIRLGVKKNGVLTPLPTRPTAGSGGLR